MDLHADYRFAAPPARVWDALMDPAQIAACVPGVQTFEPLGGDRYRVVLAAGVAAISGTFEGTVAIEDAQPPVSYRLVVEGRGQPGFVNGAATITLAAEGDGTAVHVAASVQIGGLIARVGQRLLGATAKMLTDRFFNCLQSRLAP